MAESRRLIVIVEDNEGMRLAIDRLLRASGYPTRMFASAEAVLDTQAAVAASCLVVDIRLPGLSGLEMLSRLSAETRPPVVFITADDRRAQREAAERAGAFAYLLKPFTGAALLDAVRRAVRS